MTDWHLSVRKFPQERRPEYRYIQIKKASNFEVQNEKLGKNIGISSTGNVCYAL